MQNYKEDFRKSSPTIYKKDNTSWTGTIYIRNAIIELTFVMNLYNFKKLKKLYQLNIEKTLKKTQHVHLDKNWTT
jgi:hypothetical protein